MHAEQGLRCPESARSLRNWLQGDDMHQPRQGREAFETLRAATA